MTRLAAKFLLVLLTPAFGSLKAESNDSHLETFRNPLPPHHVYQYDLGKLGMSGLIDCGPAAAAESLAFLKWTRSPNFPLLKWPGGEPMGPQANSGEYMYRQTLELAAYFKTNLWQNPFFNPLYTDSVDMVKGLRSYFKDSGYSEPWVYARGYRAFDAPIGKSVSDMETPVNLAEIRDYTKKGYGVILLVGYYNRLGKTKRRNGGHYFSVSGYNYDSSWGEERTDFIVTDSLLTSEKQPRHISLTPIDKNPKRKYPEYVTHKIDGDDTVYLDAAILFIPQLP